MNLKCLRAFLYVMEEGTLTSAAAKMHLSQPAVSRLIHMLEDDFGTPLFYRDTKSLSPTPEAESLYPEAYRVISSIDEFPQLFEQIRTASVVSFKVICHPRILNGLVIPAISKLSEQDPSIKVRLDIHSRRDMGRRIIKDKFDVGVFTLPLHVQDVEPIVFRSTEIHAILPAGHRLAGRKVLSPKDMADENYIALKSDTVLRQAIDRALMKAGKKLNVTHETSAGYAAYQMAKQGMGFTLSDPISLEQNFFEDVVLVPWQPVTKIDFGCYVPKSTRVHQDYDLFIDCLNAVCDERLAIVEDQRRH